MHLTGDREAVVTGDEAIALWDSVKPNYAYDGAPPSPDQSEFAAAEFRTADGDRLVLLEEVQ